MSHPARFDFDGFLASVADLGFAQMVQAIDAECGRAEASITGRGGPRVRAEGAAEYVRRLKQVLFWFHYGRPAPNGTEAAACRRIAESLVAKGQIKPGALTEFG